ncbi:MAG: carbonic anhydrase family protein [Pseudonocardiaceae bacterium]
MALPGTAQSPIDFRESEITFVDRLPRIEFSYPQSTAVTVVNTGSPDEFATVRADVPLGAASLTLEGVRYSLLQFHWHTPSEHEIEGRKTPLEMHLVHRRADGALLVIGVFMEQGHANRPIDPIFRELPEHPGATHVISGVRLMRLLPERRESFRYSGSLTTPPFTEGVQFIVLADAMSLSERQIGSFQELFEDGNSREVQPRCGREVLSDADDVFDDD